MPFVHLQVKSAYSLLTSSVRLDKLVSKAKDLNFKALALTDFQVMYGTVPFYKLCKKNGIKPIIGLTIKVLDESSEEQQTTALVLLAENNKGYRNLIKISSALQTKSVEGLPERWLKSYSEGLIAISPKSEGLVEKYQFEQTDEKIIEVIRKYMTIFGENSFYLGLQKSSNHNDDFTSETISLSKKIGVPVVATNDVSYIEKEDFIAQQCLLAIKNNEKLSEDLYELDHLHENNLKSAKEMVSIFEQFPEALENTIHIANRCEVNLELGISRLPKFPTATKQSADEFLTELCLKGLAEKNCEDDFVYKKRLAYELEVIKKMKFSDYFLIVWDFMKYAHEHNILTGPGRGSAAGSLVSYVLNITNVDPIKHKLLFERFLNPERISMPDIDIDFPDTRRDEVIDYVAKKYGKMHVAQIITFGTLGARAAIRDVGRVLGASPKDTDILSKLVPSRPGILLSDALKESQALTKLINSDSLFYKIIDTALKVEGLPRHTSTHAAGVVLSDQPLTSIVPIQEGQTDVYLTQFSMDFLEELGLLKMDFLGLRNLSLIENITKSIQRGERQVVNLMNISYQDQKTFELLANGDTTGIFQLESEGMRSVLKRLKPTNLEDIVAVNALYRPGPMENIPIYIDRKHNRSEIDLIHPALEPILRNTYGVIVYQEQIMELASTIAGFSLGEADLLRRAVGKKKKEILDKERVHFVTGCIKKGYSEQVGHAIYDLIVKFANYGFNRSHAVAYSMISYQLAYLKANYPIYFIAALLSSVSGNEDKVTQYVREAKQKELTILPPSINKSEYRFSVEGNSIRFSLTAIKNVGVSAIKEIFHARRKKRFTDLFDFCIRVSMKIVTRRTMEQLIFAGAMDEFEEDRATLLASLDVAIEHAELMKPADDNQFDLFLDDEFMLKPKYIEVDPFKIDEKLKFEKEALGFYFSSHPVEIHRPTFDLSGAVNISELSSKLDKKVSVGAMIVSSRTIRTKKGDNMSFIMIGDETGDVDAVLFPQVYMKHSEELKLNHIFLFEGKVETRDDRLQFIVNQMVAVDEIKTEESKAKLFIKIDKDSMDQQKLLEVKIHLKNFQGTTPVFVYYGKEKVTVKLPSEFFISPSEECLEGLVKILGKENVVLQKR
ncbi:DNA polymerase III subunit alpha [Metabacillus litoralis]|uniref:DNA polymerase III subunit alpha n=1 Tax=Metabacillus litoralis TaxID=152268 RepID=A0A5C6W1L7_9BACI|nr:DNA polymerase III subunit alpha [Metabacillus litoralis]TXC90201.1 DNA polymerase III subunit alpha [Metabacillus litoralis]